MNAKRKFVNFWNSNVLLCLKFEEENLRNMWKSKAFIGVFPLPAREITKIMAGMVLPFRGGVQIPHIDLIVATKCSLRCKYCTQWNPYIKDAKIYNAADIINNMTYVLNNVDYIHRVALLGGELFLNREVDTILEFLLKQKKIGKVVVITNGTIFPKENVLKKLKNRKIEVWIDRYGEQSRQAKKLQTYCRKNKISYRYEDAKIWYDIGTLAGKRITSSEKIKETWETCWLKNCTALIESSLYRCGRTWVLKNNKLEKPGKNEQINIKNIKNKKQMFLKLFDFYSVDMISACAWCKDKDSRTVIEAGEQLK